MTRDARIRAGLAHLDRLAHRSTNTGLWLDQPLPQRRYVRHGLAIIVGLSLLVALWVATP